MNGTWDVWWYRENIGWWLEESECGMRQITAVMRRMLHEHPDDDQTKYAFMVVPHGEKPSRYAPAVLRIPS